METKIYKTIKYADVTSFKFTLHATILGGKPTGVRKVILIVPEKFKDTQEENSWIDFADELIELFKDKYLMGAYKTKSKTPGNITKLRIRSSKEAYYYYKDENGARLDKR